jgi:exodeoxyribonuclease VII large subunit
LEKVASVSSIINHIKDLLEENYQGIAIEGEVSNFQLSTSGHYYFSLSDEQATLNCVLFKGDSLRNPLIKKVKDGDFVVLFGDISIYQKRGSFQLIAKRVMPSGEGKAKIQFELLKEKLMKEGLFDPSRKRKIPLYPKKIALITAPQGAALQDFINVFERRSFKYHFVVIPSLVQGEAAPKQLTQALKSAQQLIDIDLIVFLRGGGSQEDLSAFNNETLVRAIAESKIPVVSAIGHEVDTSLCDLVSDLRAETPTAAAELISAPQNEILHQLKFLKSMLTAKLENFLLDLGQRLTRFNPRYLIKQIAWKEKVFELEEVFNRLQRFYKQDLFAKKSKLDELHSTLNAFNPKGVLKRGYTLIKNQEGIITSKNSYQKLSNHDFSIVFFDGEVEFKKTDTL